MMIHSPFSLRDSTESSLDRIHVKNRIEETELHEGGSPIALCRQLAREMGVDLSNPLTQITPKLRARRSNDDD